MRQRHRAPCHVPCQVWPSRRPVAVHAPFLYNVVMMIGTLAGHYLGLYPPTSVLRRAEHCWWDNSPRGKSCARRALTGAPAPSTCSLQLTAPRRRCRALTMSERAWSEQQCLEGSLRVPGIAQPLTVTRNTGGGRASLYPVAAPARVVGDHTIELKLGRRTNFHDNHKPIRNGGRVFLSDECVEGRYVLPTTATRMPAGSGGRLRRAPRGGSTSLNCPCGSINEFLSLFLSGMCAQGTPR